MVLVFYPADWSPVCGDQLALCVHRVRDGTSERALVVVDAAGTVRWRHVSPIGINPGADGILRALETLVGREGGE